MSDKKHHSLCFSGGVKGSICCNNESPHPPTVRCWTASHPRCVQSEPLKYLLDLVPIWQRDAASHHTVPYEPWGPGGEGGLNDSSLHTSSLPAPPHLHGCTLSLLAALPVTLPWFLGWHLAEGHLFCLKTDTARLSLLSKCSWRNVNSWLCQCFFNYYCVCVSRPPLPQEVSV